MQYIITFIFFFSFVSCKDCIKSKGLDKRCEKLEEEARKKGVEAGVCYKRPKNSTVVMTDIEAKKLDPDPEACTALWKEAKAKCRALPPPEPDDIEWVSGSSFGGC